MEWYKGVTTFMDEKDTYSYQEIINMLRKIIG